jgi:hypothetical protein
MDIVQSLIETFPDGSEKIEVPRELVIKQRSAVMRAIELPSNENDAEPVSPFGPEATEVLQSLRLSVASALSDIGDFSKPADVHKVLQLDRTLARQLFRLASTSEALGNGGMIPSRTSIDRFLSAAQVHGAGTAKIKAVRDAYNMFEQLVQTHAGDRATFNSMVSAARGVDESWHATDLQHRRNAYRAMSHAVGVQAKTRLLLFIAKESDDQKAYDVAAIGGFIGLRVLRSLPTVRISGVTADPHGVHTAAKVTSGPISLSSAGGGYVLEEFSSSPLPALATREGSNNRGAYREIVLENPIVGNVGSSTLMFGTLFRGIPRNLGDPLRLHAAGGKPVETLLFDALIAPNLRQGGLPTGQAVIGLSEEYNAEIVKLQGNFDVEFLGKGPRALATPEVPRYGEMVKAIDGKLGWNLDNYDAWRLRVEFPIYQSKITMEWPPLRGFEE